MCKLYFMVRFVNMRKNFPDAQKLSFRQCGHADGVFGTLRHASMALELYAKNACKCWRIFSFGGILGVLAYFYHLLGVFQFTEMVYLVVWLA